MLFLLLACSDPPTAPLPADADGDRAPDVADCAPLDPSVFPGARDRCDHVDNDCDGTLDEDGPFGTWWADLDGDGHGDETAPVVACEKPAEATSRGGDCAPNDPEAHPGAPERCNGQDDDCDGGIDEVATDALTWYKDQDGDGHGDDTTAHVACADPGEVWVPVGGDCDDHDPAVFPGALERCETPGVDDDCDGAADEPGASGGTAWYVDVDGDDWGAGDPRWGCAAGDGEAAATGDCDDGDPWVNPGALEGCGGGDEDCDGSVDTRAADAAFWYVDADGDGYGDPGLGARTCTPAPGAVLRGDDCDDADPAVHPDAEEDCALAVDLNCDGLAGPGDGDGDGYAACRDCDDGDRSVSPAAEEVCDGVDQDCDGRIDTGAAGYALFHPDRDHDGYGAEDEERGSCEPIPGWTEVAEDCDDGDAAVSPAEEEICRTAADDDCDGDTNDPRAIGCTNWYADRDGDGVAGDTRCLCDALEPYVEGSGGDCDDHDADVSPDAEDGSCDGRDADCDGTDCVLTPTLTLLALREPAVVHAAADDAIWVGAPNYYGGEVGRYPLDGSVAAGEAVDALYSTDTTSDFGYSLDVGDVDGDGLEDLLVGAWGDGEVATGGGAVSLFLGPVTGALDPDAAWAARWGGSSGTAYIGAAVLITPDLTGDGVVDGWLASHTEDRWGTDAGAVYHAALDAGEELGVADSDLVLTPDGAGGAFGWALAGGEDLSGDGVGDLAVSAFEWDGGGSALGAVYVFEGPIRTDTSALDADAVWEGASSGAYLGQVLADAGDVDEDGVADLWVSDMQRTAYLLTRPGDAGGRTADARTIVAPPGATAYFANALVGGLDLDASGVPDLVVTDAAADSRAGWFYLFADPPAGTLTEPTRLATGGGLGSYTGVDIYPLPGLGPDGADTFATTDAGGDVFVVDPTELLR